MSNKNVEKYYVGYFLMDSGIKIPFEISEEDGGEEFSNLYGNMEFSWKKGDIIYLGEIESIKILADRIIGWDINEFER